MLFMTWSLYLMYMTLYSWTHLVRVLSLVALALTTHAAASPRAVHQTRVVWSTVARHVHLLVSGPHRVTAALALAPKVSAVTLADAALVRSEPGALGRLLLVVLYTTFIHRSTHNVHCHEQAIQWHRIWSSTKPVRFEFKWNGTKSQKCPIISANYVYKSLVRC